MRVALFTETFLPKVDGVVNTLCRLLEHLARRQHESILFAPNGGPPSFANTPVFGLPSVPFPLYPELKLVPPVISVLDQLRRFSPDIIHVVNPVTLGFVGLNHGRRLRVPTVASYHTDVPSFARQWGLGALYHPSVGFFRWLHNQADLNLCPSFATLRQLQSQGYRRLRVWGRGVDSHLFHPSRCRHSWRMRLSEGEPERPLLLYVGRLSPEKRIDWLKPMLQAVPEARMAIVGDGPMRPVLESMFAGHPVRFTGYLTSDELADAYAAADVFVFPSHSETFGNVVLEAMASGLPVVAARSGGVQEQVVDSVTGLLFEAESQADFVACVTRLVRDLDWGRHLGAQGRTHVESRSWNSVLDGLLDEYAMVAQSRSKLAEINFSLAA